MCLAIDAQTGIVCVGVDELSRPLPAWRRLIGTMHAAQLDQNQR